MYKNKTSTKKKNERLGNREWKRSETQKKKKQHTNRWYAMQKDCQFLKATNFTALVRQCNEYFTIFRVQQN